MAKQKIVDMLKEKGYNAKMEENLPTLYIQKGDFSENQIRELFRDNGYTGSFRYILKNSENNNDRVM